MSQPNQLRRVSGTTGKQTTEPRHEPARRVLDSEDIYRTDLYEDEDGYDRG